MGDRSLTLLELHFHSDGDVQVGPRWLGQGEESEQGGGRSLPLGLVGAVGLVVLAAGAAAAWRKLEGA